MSHTHSNLLTHVVFSTQGFLPVITDEMKSELYAYIGGLVKNGIEYDERDLWG